MRLTNPKRLIYDMEKFHGGSISVICGSIVTKAKFSADVLTAAVNELYRINDALRIRITETDAGPMQEIEDYTRREVKVPSIPFHALRHTFATHALSSGVDAKTLAGILGHTRAGFTLGELMALQWDDLNMTTGELRINKQVYPVNGKLAISEPKTDAGIRTIILPLSVLNVMREYRKTIESQWMFPSPKVEDAPIGPSVIRHRLYKLLDHAGCRQVRFHDLRHP